MQEFLEMIQNLIEVMVRVTAFGDNANQVRGFIAEWQECALLGALGSLLERLKASVDYLITKDCYRP